MVHTLVIINQTKKKLGSKFGWASLCLGMKE